MNTPAKRGTDAPTFWWFIHNTGQLRKSMSKGTFFSIKPKVYLSCQNGMRKGKRLDLEAGPTHKELCIVPLPLTCATWILTFTTSTGVAYCLGRYRIFGKGVRGTDCRKLSLVGGLSYGCQTLSPVWSPSCPRYGLPNAVPCRGFWDTYCRRWSPVRCEGSYSTGKFLKFECQK